MKLSAFEAIIQALQDAGVRYLVVGGVAVNAHGYIRFTPNIDLALELKPVNIQKALRALETLHYRPSNAVDAEVFANRNQNSPASAMPEPPPLSFHGDDDELTPVNLLTMAGLDFSNEYEQAMQSEILPGVEVRFLSIPGLIRLKQTFDRPRDRDDIQHLQWLGEDYSHIDENDEDFLRSMTSFEGARKMQLIQAKKLSVRQRLESLDDLRQVCEHLQKMRLVPVLRESSAGEKRRPNS